MNIAINTLGYTACSDCKSIYNIKQVKEINKIDTFDFTVLPDDPLYSLLKTNKCSYITAYDETEYEVVFRGRITSLSPSSSGNSSETKVSCEGALGYLKDSICWGTYVETNKKDNQDRYFENKPNVSSILGPLISSHNLQVEPYMRFNFVVYSTVNPVSDSDKGILTQSHSFDGVSSFDVLFDLLEDLNWECMVTYNDSNPHWTLHIAKRFGFYVADPIVTGLNLKSLSGEIDGSELVTRVFPLGGVGYDEKRLTLTDISLGGPLCVDQNLPGDQIMNPTTGMYNKAYVDNDDLVSKWGARMGVVTFDDIVANSEDEVKEKRQILRNKAIEHARKLSDVKTSFSASAYDLYYAGYDINKLQLHNYYTVRDTIGDITVQARLVKNEINYDNKLDSEPEFTVDSSDSEASVS